MVKTKPAPLAVQVTAPETVKSFADLTGSKNNEFGGVLINQVANCLRRSHSGEKDQDAQFKALMAAMAGINPRDEIEGMLAAQMVAVHNASMECLRRAMLTEQTFEGRRENLNQANKLARTFTAQMEALIRYRGKGQQKMTVEHVHIHEGGQAIVGNIQRGAGHE
jgi:hypothetical protein